jgi:hypothetical protein
MIRDRKYLDWLKTQRCILTGFFGSDFDAVDPAHIGTAGKGLKSPDNEALPILHSLHVEAHQKGEIRMLREKAPDDVIRAAFRALAREHYAAWLAEQEKAA